MSDRDSWHQLIETYIQVIAEIGSGVRGIEADVEDEVAVEAAFAKIGQFDHLFISAQDAATAPLSQKKELR